MVKTSPTPDTVRVMTAPRSIPEPSSSACFCGIGQDRKRRGMAELRSSLTLSQARSPRSYGPSSFSSATPALRGWVQIRKSCEGKLVATVPAARLREVLLFHTRPSPRLWLRGARSRLPRLRTAPTIDCIVGTPWRRPRLREDDSSTRRELGAGIGSRPRRVTSGPDRPDGTGADDELVGVVGGFDLLEAGE